MRISLRSSVLVAAMLVAPASYATPVGDALNACISSGQVRKINHQGAATLVVAILCHKDAARSLYTELQRVGFKFTERKTDNGQVRDISFGNSNDQLKSECAFRYLDRDGVSDNYYRCAIGISVTNSLLSNMGF